jgi:hypothetical protein
VMPSRMRRSRMKKSGESTLQDNAAVDPKHRRRRMPTVPSGVDDPILGRREAAAII